MTESTLSGSSLSGDGWTKEEVNERIDIGIAFLVLLFMGALGAYLMTATDTPAGFELEAPAERDGVTLPMATAVTGSTTADLVGARTDERDIGREAERLAGARAYASQTSVPAAATSQGVVPVSPTPQAVMPVEVPSVTAPDISSSAPAVTAPETLVSGDMVTESERPVQSAIAQEATPEPAESAVAPSMSEAFVVPVEERSANPEPAEVSERESALLRSATQNVSFVVGSAQLTQASRSVLDDIAALLKSRPNTRLSVIGFTDAQGDADENVALSFARAEACRDYLLQQGVSVAQVDSAGMGSRRPIGDNATPEGRRQNRRVEFTLLQGGN